MLAKMIAPKKPHQTNLLNGFGSGHRHWRAAQSRFDCGARILHPLYLGFIPASFGSLFMCVTWTTMFFACSFAPIMIRSAHREEAGLAAEFGEQWQEYWKRVPVFFPR